MVVSGASDRLRRWGLHSVADVHREETRLGIFSGQWIDIEHRITKSPGPGEKRKGPVERFHITHPLVIQDDQ